MAWWFASPTALSITGTILLIWILWLVMSTALGRGCFCIGAAVRILSRPATGILEKRADFRLPIRICADHRADTRQP